MNCDKSVRIWVENLAAMNVSERLPLSELTVDEHVHGGLRIQLGGRAVPCMGFFGPDDVCLITWLEELWAVAEAFDSSPDGCYTFDEGEQGQPAFVFSRSGDTAFLTIATSELSGGDAHPEWQSVPFSPSEFLREHKVLRDSFFHVLRTEAPAVADEWIRKHDPMFRHAKKPPVSS